MSVMDHRERNGHCIWCHETWPCSTGLTRRELAKLIRRMSVGSTGDPQWDSGREAGRDSAADAIDI